MKIRAVLVALLVLAGCAQTAPVIDAAAGPCWANAPGGPPGNWLIGRWSHPYNILDIRRQGELILFAWERAPGLETDRWGGKAPARGLGQVTRIAGCTVEMSGNYSWSTNDAIIGRPMVYKLTLDGPAAMRGQWFGAGGMWLDVGWRKEP